jgi:hypothetical protein
VQAASRFPFSADPARELEAIDQQATWITMSLVTGEPYIIIHGTSQ